MADICKCTGQIGAIDCPHKEQCYRYTSEADEYQSYFTESPIKDGKCDHYWGGNAEAIWSELKEITKKPL